MILFIAPNPFKEKKREGYLQRVAAVDTLFPHEEKVYFDDLKPNEKVTALNTAKMIYVHSLYMAEKIVYEYPFLADKIVTDLHGVVPEEEKYTGNDERSRQLAKVEAIVFRYGKKFVAVTDAMVKYYKKKYQLADDITWIRLPIFNAINTGNIDNKPVSNTVIYAGGAQKWQGVDKMVATINKKSNSYEFTILTHDTDAFKEIESRNVTIKTVKSDAIADYYEKSTFGFILREDIVVNRVACPTKLIEYLEYGVIPITELKGIGDFKELGYKSFSLDDFINGKIDEKKIITARRANLKVIDSLKKITVDGENSLKQLFLDLSKQPHDSNDILEVLLEASSDKVEANLVVVKDKEIQHLREKIKDYAQSVDYLKNELEEIRNSKKWQMLSRLPRGRKSD